MPQPSSRPRSPPGSLPIATTDPPDDPPASPSFACILTLALCGALAVVFALGGRGAFGPSPLLRRGNTLEWLIKASSVADSGGGGGGIAGVAGADGVAADAAENAAPPPPLDIWVLAGQSNCVGMNAPDGQDMPEAAAPMPGRLLMYDGEGE